MNKTNKFLIKLIHYIQHKNYKKRLGIYKQWFQMVDSKFKSYMSECCLILKQTTHNCLRKRMCSHLSKFESIESKLW